MKKKLQILSQSIFLLIFTFLFFNNKINLWILIFIAFLILTPLLGRVYCSWICPMNTVMIPTEWISKKLNIQSKTTPKGKLFKILPWLMLALLIGSMLFLRRNLGIEIPILLYLVGFSIIITLRYKPRLFHNKICPFGALLKTAGKISFLSHTVDKEKCIGCKKCETVCPTGAISVNDGKANIDKEMCHQCLNCLEICPVNAIEYTRK
ncbi:MAG: 4Fe-4S binding protein [Fusobacteriota bacterium]